ncbi:subtilisin-like serine protease [Solibacillus silvestris StLB046]|uniref:Subtilisin-like serine protease n=1 Tax=Solibacillus silvestris (strain StLB046) TaxID=1002809 RepID=F2F3V8_SOLSS|nr:S8 family serine peptidase [Solibacillus silvestris]BAK17756.1 subtilisin-like serine protease [Solibacillus silvestris StLB046]
MYKLFVLSFLFITSLLIFAPECAAQVFLSKGKVDQIANASIEYLENVDISIIAINDSSRTIKDDNKLYYEDSTRIISETPPNVIYNRKWYIDNYDFNFTWSYEPINATKVAIIDTGISEELLRKKNISPGKNFINETKPPIDDNGHGTALASIIYDISGPYPIEIIPLKSANSKGLLDVSTIIKAIDYAIELDVDIINLSFGAKSPHDLERRALQKAVDSGITVISSVGNSGIEEYYYPAAYDNVLAIGSINQNHVRSSFSTTNDILDFVSPGEKLLVQDYTMLGSTKIVNGTSFSSAYFTGQLAILHTNLLHYSLKQLKTLATDLGIPGYDKEYGNGFIMSDYLLKSLRGKNWETFITSNSMKSWSISLSLPVNPEISLNKYIKIYNGHLQQHPVSIEITDSANLTVTPNSPLAPGEYWLVIDTELQSSKGTKLAQPAIKKIIIN